MYRVAAQLVASRVVLSSTELVNELYAFVQKLQLYFPKLNYKTKCETV
jgi:hypothetical protein